MEIESTPNSPEAQAVEKEYADIMSNPQNPRHAGLHRGDPQVSAHIDGLYKKAFPNSAPVKIGKQEGLPATTDLTDEMRAQVDVEVELRMELGEAYDTVMQEMAHGAQYLFNGDGGQSALTVLSDRIAGLGPKAEALGVKFLADLSKLQHQGG
jgi:hypothetical protein